jgi:hypothetical protein
MPVSPLRRETTICVLSTRSPPPNTYGALKLPRLLMKTSSAEPASAGASMGSVMRTSRRQGASPSPRAASSSDGSSRASPACTKRYTYTYIVYACTKTIAHGPLSRHGASARPSARCTTRVTIPLSP